MARIGVHGGAITLIVGGGGGGRADLRGAGPIFEGTMMKRSFTALVGAWAVVSLPLLAGSCVAQEPVKQEAGGNVGGEFADADALLTALEKADEGMVTLTAKVVYEKTFEIQGDQQTRKGKLYFVNKQEAAAGAAPAKAGGAGGRKFAIVFDELWIGDVVRKDQEVFVFDGQWLVEKNFKEKNFIKRQVVPPGEKFDPLRIGEGPFPLPLGQKKADIQKRYVATLLPAGDGLKAADDASEADKKTIEKRKAHTAGSWQVKLDPKPEFAREDSFKEIRLWYKRGSDGNLMPVMSRTVDTEGNVSVVALSDVQLQGVGKPVNEKAKVPREIVDTESPSLKDGWNVDVQEFRRHKGE